MIFPDTALVSRVEQSIRRQGLFRPGDTLVVALSGGADSSALLDLLSQLPGYNLHLIVAHLNHTLRGAESDADQEFCRELASRYGLPFEVRRVDVRGMATELRLNLEDAGRKARIEFMDGLRTSYGAAAVALGHHADDQAETVLMRLLRGSGMTGLSGMAYRNDRGYVRPLLEVSRAELEQYLRSRGLGWREDASNCDTLYLRNRIRHQLLPLLEEYNPAIRASLAATASIIREDAALLEELTEQSFAEFWRMEEGRGSCHIPQFRTLPLSLRRKVLRHAFRRLTGSLAEVGLSHIDALCSMLDSDRPNARLSLPQQVTAVREYDRLLLLKSDKIAGEQDFELIITGPGNYLLPDGRSLTVAVADAGVRTAGSCTAFVNSESAPFPWLIRTFRPGDRITPFGMSGRKKVKDVFIDRKIPASERTRIPLLFCGNDLLWIVGVSVSELCRTDTAVNRAIQVVWHG